MSFLWKGNIHTENTNNCKDCINKDKRISDYDVYFNEMKAILKSNEDNLNHSQAKIDELNKKIEEQDLTIQTQIAFREKLIKEYEFCKQVHVEERKQYLEDMELWRATKNRFESSEMEWEMIKTNHDQQIIQLLEEKSDWKKHQKILQEKIDQLTHSLIESEKKYDDIVSHMRQLEEKHVLSQESLEEMYRNKLSDIEEEYEKREDEWRKIEEDYELSIMSYQEKEIEYEMKIQELKYDLDYQIEAVENKYKMIIEERDDEWSHRINTLNESYDEEFIQYKEYFNNKEQILEEEKKNMEITLKKEIQQLKQENIQLEEAKRQIEKKRSETSIQEQSKNVPQTDRVESIVQIDTQNILSDHSNENIQKKMEKECQTLSDDHLGPVTSDSIEINQKRIKNIISENKGVQTEQFIQSCEPLSHMTNIAQNNIMDNISDHHHTGLRRRDIKKKSKRNHQPDVEEPPSVVVMSKEDQKKINNDVISYGDLYSNWNNFCPMFQLDHGHHVIDIYDDEDITEYDYNNFFLSSKVQNKEENEQVNLLEEKIKEYENEIQQLKEKNQEYLSKIQGYECNSILELNRKIRTGIPVRFFPSHTKQSLTNTSHINLIDIDLH